MIDDTGFSGQGFWFRNYPTFAGSFNPTANGTPLVHMSVMEYVSGTPPVTTADMPFVGVYMEGYTATGQQQQIGAVLLNINNGVTGFTIGGQSLATADNFYTRNAWHDLEVDFNFTTQTYSATLDGAPVVFTNGTSNFTSLPFRNTNGPTVSLAEYGFQASFNESSGTTANNAFFDNFMLTALNPVPEPSSLLLLGAGAAGVAFPGLRRWRKGGAAKA
jgi:hypothetical protein